MLFNQFFRHNFPGAHDIGAGGPFRATYTCYSAAFIPDPDRERLNVENGGKILLPQAALERLIDQVKSKRSFLHEIHLSSLGRCHVI